jgi:aryl-alcohol dehydrogenase-like predicted oxidoreductase
MQYRTLGRTGVEVSSLCLGTMMFGAWGNTDEAECRKIVHEALDAGVNVVDTADVYAAGQSEEILGRALAGRRDDVIVATKFHEPLPDQDRNRRGNSRRWIVTAVEDSLRRLGTDWIDIYQVHRPDPRTDLDETLGALTDLVRQGKVRYIGTSSFPADEIVEAQWVAERRHRERFTVEQLPYSLFARHAESAALPTCARYGMGVLAWSPLNGGWLTGKYRAGGVPAADSRASRNAEHFDFRAEAVRIRKLELVEQVATIAADAGLSMIDLALDFVLAHSAVTSAIIGPRTLAQLHSQLTAADVVLPADVLDRLDALVPPGTLINPSDAGYARPFTR